MNKVDIIRDLTKFKCTSSSVDVSKLSFCDRLKDSVQEEIACYVTNLLKRHTFEEKLSLVQATKSLQKDFILKELSNFEDSEQGMTYRVATKDYPKSFAVMKFAFNITPIEQDNILHEIAIGLILNSLRQYTPNFMYTYGGFICSPPLDRHRIEMLNELQGIFNEIFKLDPMLRNMYMDLVDSEEELEGAEDKTYFLDYLPTLRDYSLKILRRLRIEPSLRLIQKYKEELSEILEESTRFSRPTFRRDRTADKKKLKECLEAIDSMSELVFKHEDKIKELIAKLGVEESKENRLCANDDQAVILLTEFFNDAQTFFEFSNNEPSTKDASQVILQIVLSMIIAHKKIGYKHSDLHVENVLIQKNDERCTLTYVLGTKTIQIRPNYIARIIDFGFSTADYKGKKVSPNFSDNYFEDMFSNKSEKDDLMWYRRSVIDNDFYDKFTKDLLALDSYEQMEEFIVRNL